jgi:diaminopimelate decarboxylase
VDKRYELGLVDTKNRLALEYIMPRLGKSSKSADCFRKFMQIRLTKRSDIIAIRTTGASGEVMSSHYNVHEKVQSYYSGGFD